MVGELFEEFEKFNCSVVVEDCFMVFLEINFNYFEEKRDIFEGGYVFFNLKFEDVKLSVVEIVRWKVWVIKVNIYEVICFFLKWCILYCEMKKVGFLLNVNVKLLKC